MNTANTDTITCPSCEEEFDPKRKNQTYCSRPCQKSASHNTARGGRAGENKARSASQYERAGRLAEMLYSVAPTERLGLMKYILSFVSHDAGLRNILTDLQLLKAKPRADSRKNIAQAASAYTFKFFGVSIQTYIRQTRDGSLNEFHPVQHTAVPEAVPMLGEIKNVKVLAQTLA